MRLFLISGSDIGRRLTLYGLSWLFTASIAVAGAPSDESRSLIESISVSTPLPAPSDGTYWMQARPAIIPADPNDGKRSAPRALITLQKIDRVGTHMYHGIEALWSGDFGKSWLNPEALAAGERRQRAGGLLDTPADMTPQYHVRTGVVLVTGVSFELDPKLRRDVPQGVSDTIYMVYDPRTNAWAPWKVLAMPDRNKFYFARSGCSQRVDLANGDVLLPIYFQAKDSEVTYATVVHCKFDGSTLQYVKHGTELTVDGPTAYRGKGLYEPSLTRFRGRFYLTIRGVERAYVASSDDGLTFNDLKPWTFDDGKELGSLNTQQHWVTHSEGLFLSYTRRDAKNEKVFRSRAPLYIARVDPARMVVERATEQILLPNLGDAFGNFGVCAAAPRETWVVDCLRNAKPDQPSVYLARIRWARDNQLLEP